MIYYNLLHRVIERIYINTCVLHFNTAGEQNKFDACYLTLSFCLNSNIIREKINASVMKFICTKANIFI